MYVNPLPFMALCQVTMKQIPKEAKICSPEVQVSEPVQCPPCCPKAFELHHFSHCSQGCPWSSCFSSFLMTLMVRTRSTIAPLLIGSFVSWRTKLPSTHSRNLWIACVLPCSSNRYSGGWSPPLARGLTKVRLFLSFYRGPHVISFLSHGACSRLPV